MIHADTSFLVALFVEGDEHWHRAWHWWTSELGPAILVSRLTVFEAENTIRGLGASKQLRQTEMQSAIEGIHRALLEGVLIRRSIPEHRCFPHAHRLSRHHTLTCTYGALDILHVAAAIDLQADRFLSFDQRQRDLAAAEGLAVAP